MITTIHLNIILQSPQSSKWMFSNSIPQNSVCIPHLPYLCLLYYTILALPGYVYKTQSSSLCNNINCEIWGSHGSEDSSGVILGCYTIVTWICVFPSKYKSMFHTCTKHVAKLLFCISWSLAFWEVDRMIEVMNWRITSF